MSKTLTKHVKTCFRSQNWPGGPGWFMSSKEENLSKIIINSSRLQMRWSIYVFRSARREECNSATHSSICGNWKITKSGLAGFGNRPGSGQLPKKLFPLFGPQWDDPSMLSERFDDRNKMLDSIMHFEPFWVSTYAPLFLVKLAY